MSKENFKKKQIVNAHTVFEEFGLGRYRGRLDIIADILRVVSGDAKKTQIMYQANLSYKLLQRYLAEIVEASLIRFKDESQCYMLTAKGQKFLEAYQKYSKTNRHLKKRLANVLSKKEFLRELVSSR